LLLGARLRDEIALAVLYDRYGSLIYSLALRIVGDRNLAEHVLQRVFLRCWNGRERYDASAGTAPVWLLGMAREIALEVAGAHEITVVGAISSLGQRRAGHGSDGPESGQAAVLRAMVGQALTVVSGRERTAIETAFYGGLTREQIADRLGQSPAAVGLQIRDGLRRLSHTLAPIINTATADASSAP
jgi:RNA polymerase sigma-70 factor (ECF subfamily)